MKAWGVLGKFERWARALPPPFYFELSTFAWQSLQGFAPGKCIGEEAGWGDAT